MVYRPALQERLGNLVLECSRAKDMWLYEDNDGYTHFCVPAGNKIQNFTRTGSQPHQDDGTAAI